MTQLVLEDGTVYRGRGFGVTKDAIGEVVFNTSMTGYQEMLTDPSYKGQLLVLTYPLIGNYGINDHDFQSTSIQPSGLIVRWLCDVPDHNESEKTLEMYLKDGGASGVFDLDTRAITRKIRSKGAMMGIITSNSNTAQALKKLRNSLSYGSQSIVEAIDHAKHVTSGKPALKNGVRPTVALIDYGVKTNIIRLLNQRGCDVYIVPCTADLSSKIAEVNLSGVVLSPGPGDPALESVDGKVLRQLLERGVPVLGICLGHQILAREFGATTYKLKFGHRGGNQPIKDIASERVCVTAHNHGYAVSEKGLPEQLEITHTNLNDGTVEGLRHKTLPLWTIQYHAEAAPGPTDAEYIFDEFVERAKSQMTKV